MIIPDPSPGTPVDRSGEEVVRCGVGNEKVMLVKGGPRVPMLLRLWR